jgi:hypothetical protein
MLAHGFTLDFLVELIRTGMARPSAWSQVDARWKSPA